MGMLRIGVPGLALILLAPVHALGHIEPLIDLSLYDQGGQVAETVLTTNDTEQVSSLESSCDYCEVSCGVDACSGTGGGDGIGCGSGVGSAGATNPCAESHKGVFYANDFSYLKDPSYNGWCLGDALKLKPVAGGDWGTFDIGGQARLRYHSEVGMGREGSATTPRFRDTTNDFLLARFRLYSNWKVNDWLRLYSEGIYAEVTTDGGDYFPRPIDIDQGDFLNLFADVKMTDCITVRAGRQELLYGAQRLVSPLDWGNTRRTFEGAKLMYKKGDLAIDTFFTYLVVVNPDQWNEADSDLPFYGSWARYGGFENFTVDAYYLGKGNRPSDESVHTIGLRLDGAMGNWLWEIEGGPQFGKHSSTQDQSASFATCGVGRKLTDYPTGTTIWCYYDYASGDDGAGNYNGFDQLYPLAHQYLGFIDAVQRSNIETPNVLITMKPGLKWDLLLWYYHFMSNTNAPVPSNGNTAPQSVSKDLGDELDVLLKYSICPRSNVIFGWSHFWRGNKLANALGDVKDADFLYSQWTVNF